MATQSYNFLKSSPVRAFLVCEDLKNFQHTGPDVLPHTLELFLNPTSIKFNTAASWARMDVPGLSHQVLQYSHTESNKLSFEVAWHKLEAARRQSGRSYQAPTAVEDWKVTAQQKTTELAMLYKDWLYALTLPIKAGRAPSRVTLVWPGFLNVVGVVTSVDFTFDIFSTNGDVMGFVADIEMLELRRNFVAARDSIRFFDRRVSVNDSGIGPEVLSNYISSED